jgi:hypothetical protein
MTVEQNLYLHRCFMAVINEPLELGMYFGKEIDLKHTETFCMNLFFVLHV